MPTLTRFLPLMALPLAIAAVATTTGGTTAEPLDFSLQAQGDGSNSIAATFFTPGERHHHWNSQFRATEFDGLDVAALRSSGSNPVRFAMIRESGRLDCSGSGGLGHANGRCSFAPQPAFGAMLAASGVGTPKGDGWLSMFAVDVHRSLVEALAAANYPPPNVDQLIELSAVGVSGDYIRALSAAGYRPSSLDDLVEMRAVGVTPEWIASFGRAGLGRLPASQLVELRALGIDAEYVASMRALGFASMKPDDLVELKALGVTADYVASMRNAGYADLKADDLVEMKALGVTADFAREVERHMGRQSPDRLVELKALGVSFRN